MLNSQTLTVTQMMRGRPCQLQEHVCCHGNPMTSSSAAITVSSSGRFTIFGHQETHSRLCCCHRQQELTGRHPVPSVPGAVPMATVVLATGPHPVVTHCPVIGHHDLHSLILTPPTRYITMATADLSNILMCCFR